MKKRIQLPPAAKRASRLKPGKGWRPLKAGLVAMYTASGERYAIFKLRE